MLGWLWSGLLLAVLTFLVLYPSAMLLVGSLTDDTPVAAGYGGLRLSPANFVEVIAIRTSIWRWPTR
jgi:iron(III) transport system permease protein